VKPSEPKSLTILGNIVGAVISQEWPKRLGNWEETEERCQAVIDAIDPDGLEGWKVEQIKSLLYRNGLIIYDTDSGWWYSCLSMPKQDYADGEKSPELIKREECIAESERNGVSQVEYQRRKIAKMLATRWSNKPRSRRPDDCPF